MSRWLVVGLGNPPDEYQRNRHNVGFMFIDRFSSHFNKRVDDGIFSWFKSFNYERARYKSDEICLVKPRTFMNLSGKPVSESIKKFGVELSKMIVVYDDVYLRLGEMRVRRSGGAGGHRGMKSVIESISTDEFPRLRIGIGPPPEGIELSDFVLSDFTGREMMKVDEVLDECVECVLLIIRDGIERAMQSCN